MSRDRLARISDLIREVLSEAIARHVKDPRVGFVTITRVKVSFDLNNAVVYFSALGTEEEQERSLAALTHASGFLKGILSREVRLRKNPDLHFVFDKGVTYSMEIESILRGIHAEEAQLDRNENEEKNDIS